MQKPLAVAIISGLAVQLPVVLLVMPAVYSLLLHITRRSNPKRASGA
jgi:multidrug efflux pump subunit AcrB